MAQAAGIYIERNANGIPQYARIDIKKYGDQLKDFFNKNNVKVEESLYDPEFVAMIKLQENKTGVKLKASDVWK
ncbi:hypothetical protein FACS189428_1080 [Clostridia bacterium]|nr:hypothetical protein FACS189428_1080 [Clostridia bacterium]